jgi:hypothetical protein
MQKELRTMRIVDGWGKKNSLGENVLIEVVLVAMRLLQ